jgi:hypothetical protein
MTMTFEQFQASKTWCDDLPNELVNSNEGERKPRGWLYVGSLYVEQVTNEWPENCRDEGGWYLLLERDEWITDDLEALERKLYAWAMSSGWADVGINDLIGEYETWNKINGLDLGSADEHLFDEDLTDAQRAWLRNFSARWEQVAQGGGL